MSTAAPGNNNDLKAVVHRIHEQAAGAMLVEVTRKVDIPELMGLALAGDPDAYRVLLMVNGALARIQDAPRRKPMLCAVCPRPLRDGRYAIVTCAPMRDDPAEGLTLAICTRCATTIPEVKAKALVALQRFWPDGRMLPTPTAGGTA